MNDDNRYDRGDRRRPSDGAAVPPIETLVPVDLQHRTIDLGVVVMGAWAEPFMDHLFATTAAPGVRAFDASTPGQASVLYLPLQLGPIRGFTTRLHFYGLRNDPRLLTLVTGSVPHARGLVVTLAPGANALAEGIALAPPAVPTAILGPEAERSAFARRSGVAPVFEEASGTAAVMPAVKALSRAMLGELRDG